MMITSLHNPKLKLVRALQGRPRERREAGAFVVEGMRLVEEAAFSGFVIRLLLYDNALGQRGMSLVDSMRSKGIDTEEIPQNLMKTLSDTETPQGILAVVELLELPLPQTLDFILVPDQIRDPGNLGSLLRSAAAAGVQAVFLPPETTDPFAPKVLRAGMGAHFRVPIYSADWEKIGQLIRSASQHVFLADMSGDSCWQADLRQPLALIVGGEAEGPSTAARKLAQQTIRIPMQGKMESLNASVAGSVLMFEVLRQRQT